MCSVKMCFFCARIPNSYETQVTHLELNISINFKKFQIPKKKMYCIRNCKYNLLYIKYE